MDFDEYVQSGYGLYDAFAKEVRKILGKALDEFPKIKCQVIQARAKSVDSLKNKLGDNDTADIEKCIKDLAGVRIILYTNSDVDRLEHSRILLENFDIVWDRTKFHYPAKEDANSSHFIGQNYVVRLKETRTELAEYRRFSGLQCEIQVQTILNHAWSETAHDTIYKSPDLSGIDVRQFDMLEKRMNAIQQKYLLPAGYEFQKVLNDFERLASGQFLINAGALEAIANADDNNEVADLLDQYANLVLPIIDDIPAIAPDIRSTVITAVKKAVPRPVMPIETPFGEVPGKNLGDILEKALTVINGSFLRYIDPAATFDALVEIFVCLQEADDRQKLIAATGELAKHAMPVWHHHGPAAQEAVLQAITRMPGDRAVAVRPLIVKAAHQTLCAETSGASSTSSTITLSYAPVVVSSRLNHVRDEALALLKKIFTTAADDKERRTVFNALQNAMRLPQVDKVPDSLVLRVYRDTAEILHFLADCVDEMDNPLRQSVEHDAYYQYRWAQEVVGTKENPDIAKVRDTAMRAAIAFRDRVNSIEDYTVFKTLVGFETIFRFEWDTSDDNDAVAARDEKRKKNMRTLLASINENNADDWFSRLDRYAATESNDDATFPYLGNFISDVIEANPTLGPDWLDRSQNRAISDFTPEMLQGLYASDPKAALRWINEAIHAIRAIDYIARFLRYAEPALPDHIDKIADIAPSLEGTTAANNVLWAVATRPKAFIAGRAQQLGLNMIDILIERQAFHWVVPVGTRGRNSGFLKDFSDAERQRLFRAITLLPKIDHFAEEILSVFITDYANEVFDLFGERLALEIGHNQKSRPVHRYKAIPFCFTRLSVPANACRIAIDKVREWSKEHPALAQYYGGQFIANLFPKIGDNLVSALIEDAASNDIAKQKFVLAITKSFKGKVGVWPVLRELVATLPEDSTLLREVQVALLSTGVLSGEFGYRDALISKKESMAAWLTDERKRLQRFAKDFIQSLDNQIATAQRDAESDIAMRKLDYGESLEKPLNPDENDGENLNQ